jgi:hypothetical protein
MKADITELLEDMGEWFVVGEITGEELIWGFVFEKHILN